MPDTSRQIWCCSCHQDVQAELVTGAAIYPHRRDLAHKPMWRCPACGSYIGCHPGTKNPLGTIPSPELRRARILIHDLIDPVWRERHLSRREVYAAMSQRLGWTYHTGNLRTLEEARQAYRAAREIIRGIRGGARA